MKRHSSTYLCACINIYYLKTIIRVYTSAKVFRNTTFFVFLLLLFYFCFFARGDLLNKIIFFCIFIFFSFLLCCKKKNMKWRRILTFDYRYFEIFWVAFNNFWKWVSVFETKIVDPLDQELTHRILWNFPWLNIDINWS